VMGWEGGGLLSGAMPVTKLTSLRGKSVPYVCDDARRGWEKRLKLLSLHL
jgi:hypothetical protein